MVNRPEDRPKVVALGVGIVCLVAYFILVVLPKLQGSPAPAAPPPDAAAAAASAAAASPAGTATATQQVATAGSAAVDLYADVDDPPPAAADPFSPPVPSMDDVLPQQPKLLPAAVAAAPGATPAPGMKLALAPIAPAAPPTFTLQGIVAGVPSIAVVKIGDSTCYVREGSTIQGGPKVVHIYESGVDFRDGSRRFILAIGHSTEPVKAAVPTSAVTRSSQSAEILPALSQSAQAPSASTLPGFAPIPERASPPAGNEPERLALAARQGAVRMHRSGGRG